MNSLRRSLGHLLAHYGSEARGTHHPGEFILLTLKDGKVEVKKRGGRKASPIPSTPPKTGAPEVIVEKVPGGARARIKIKEEGEQDGSSG